MSMDKYRYVYSNGEKVKTFIYTIEDIEDLGMLSFPFEDFKLISRDKFIHALDIDRIEIYEHDIIEGNIISWTLGTMGEIVYDKAHYCYGNENEAGITALNRLNKLKVIGNIYENPELLPNRGKEC